jgi:hypothetical protein
VRWVQAAAMYTGLLSGRSAAAHVRLHHRCFAARTRLVCSSYAFGTYSPLLKTRWALTQTELNAIASIGSIGSYLGLDSGLCWDRSPSP